MLKYRYIDHYLKCNFFKPTIDKIPGPTCFILKFSSANADPPYILHIPVPSPWKRKKNVKILLPRHFNYFSSVMVSMLTSRAVDRGFDPCSAQTKDYKIGIFCFSTQQTPYRSKGRNWWHLFLIFWLPEIMTRSFRYCSRIYLQNLFTLFYIIKIHC